MIAFRSAGSLTNPMNFVSAATLDLKRGPAISEAHSDDNGNLPISRI